MKLDFNTHAVADLGTVEQFPDNLFTLGVAMDMAKNIGHEVEVPHIWVNEGTMSLHGLQSYSPMGTEIRKLTNDTSSDIADLIIDRWSNLSDEMLSLREIRIRSGMLDVGIDYMTQDIYSSKIIQYAMRDGIADALMAKSSSLALINGSSEAVTTTSVIYNDILIPVIQQKKAHSNN